VLSVYIAPSILRTLSPNIGICTPEEDFRSDFSLPTKIVNSDGMELNSDFLSSAMSTDDLVANDMVPEGFRDSEKRSALLIQLINGKRYPTVD
jgi:hypothetical protein